MDQVQMAIDTLYWTKMAAIGQWAGAVATLAAVIVALWSSRRAFSPRVQVRAQGAVVGLPGGRVQHFLSCVAFNESQGPLTISTMCIGLPNKNNVFFPHHMAGHLPARVDQFGSVQIMLPAIEVSRALVENGVTTMTGLWIIFSDASGRSYRSRFQYDPRDWTASN